MNFNLFSGDFINGIFETMGALALLQNVRAIRRDRELKGIDWRVTGFFTSWGIWNLWYYPSLDQWFSFVAGAALVTVNAVWIGHYLYYRSQPQVYTGTEGWQGSDGVSCDDGAC